MITKQQIEQWNKEFTEATPEEQRVLVAKDVIQQINAEKYYALRRTYVHINNRENFNGNHQVQEYMDEITCNCCALGGLLMSCIKYQNDATFDSMKNGIEEYKQLDIFSDSQKILIEAAFEGWEMYSDDEDYNNDIINEGICMDKYLSDFDLSIDDYNEAGDFCKSDKPNDRMIEIMENIIANNGTFKP